MSYKEVRTMKRDKDKKMEDIDLLGDEKMAKKKTTDSDTSLLFWAIIGGVVGYFVLGTPIGVITFAFGAVILKILLRGK